MAREEKFDLFATASLCADYEFFVRVAGGVHKEGVLQCFGCRLHGKPPTVRTIWIGLCDSNQGNIFQSEFWEIVLGFGGLAVGCCSTWNIPIMERASPLFHVEQWTVLA